MEQKTRSRVFLASRCAFEQVSIGGATWTTLYTIHSGGRECHGIDILVHDTGTCRWHDVRRSPKLPESSDEWIEVVW